MKCPFCDIIKRQRAAFKVWENREFVLLLDIKPINAGHLLLIPKQHDDDIFQRSPAQVTRTFLIIRKIIPIVRRITHAKRVGIAIEGFGVPHAHIHLVPVNKGNELNPLRARRASRKSLLLLQTRLVRSFRNLR